MVGKLGKALALVLMFTFITSGVAFAEDGFNPERVRYIGEIASVDLEVSSFILHCNNGEDLEFAVTEQTKFRSRGEAIKSIDDLVVGMKALVLASQDEDGNISALTVVAAKINDSQMKRSMGKIVDVNLQESLIQLETKDGELQEFNVGARTRYKSRDGSIDELSDIDPGMTAFVVALAREEQTPLALWVGVVESGEQKERFTVAGEIVNIVPGQGTFELETRNGNILSFYVTERTKFRSRDGSIQDLHDLKKGMRALVVGVKAEGDVRTALRIAAGYSEDVKGLARYDVRALGRIISTGDQSFTLETRNQGSLTFLVDGSTIYQPKNGNVDGFDDLQVGMIAAVGAKETGQGEYRAQTVAAWMPPAEGSFNRE